MSVPQDTFFFCFLPGRTAILVEAASEIADKRWCAIEGDLASIAKPAEESDRLKARGPLRRPSLRNRISVASAAIPSYPAAMIYH